jgi:hypothetical protein
VQKLHLVGVTTDHQGLIFSVRRGTKSGGFVVPLTDDLVEAISDVRTRRDEREDDTEGARTRSQSRSALSVREIQARLRVGRSIDEVAREAGVEADWVERFAAPVIAEQAQVINAARATRFVKRGRGESATALADAVRRNLGDKNVLLTDDEFDQAWSTYQLQDDVWLVFFGYRNRGQWHEAVWEFDRHAVALGARDRLATQLGYVEPGTLPSRPRPPRRAATPARSAPRPEPLRLVTPPPEREERPAKRPARKKKTASRKTASRKAVAKKRAAKKTKAATRTAAKRAPARKATSKRKATGSRKATSKRKATATRKAASKRKATASRRATSKRKAASAARRPAAKRSTAKRATPARKTPARKTAAKRAATAKRSSTAKRAATATKAPPARGTKRATAKKTTAKTRGGSARRLRFGEPSRDERSGGAAPRAAAVETPPVTRRANLPHPEPQPEAPASRPPRDGGVARPATGALQRPPGFEPAPTRPARPPDGTGTAPGPGPGTGGGGAADFERSAVFRTGLARPAAAADDDAPPVPPTRSRRLLRARRNGPLRAR